MKQLPFLSLSSRSQTFVSVTKLLPLTAQPEHGGHFSVFALPNAENPKIMNKTVMDGIVNFILNFLLKVL